MKYILFAFLMIIQGLYALADLTPAQVHALVKRVDENSAPPQYEAYMAITNYKPGAAPTEQEAHVYRKGTKVLIVITRPAIQRGQAIIRNGDDMWMYLPNSGKVLRIGARKVSAYCNAAVTEPCR